MEKKTALILSVIMYLSAILLVGYYFMADLDQTLVISPGGRVVVLLLGCLFMYTGGMLLSKNSDSKGRILKATLFIWLVLYILLLVELTLFDEKFHRNGFNIPHWNREVFRNYVNHSLNLVPFSTITYYIVNLINGNTPPYIFMYNILGNLVALTPFAFFLPLLFRKQGKFKNFAVTIPVIVICIELLQFITLSGTCDVDDLILNSLGAYIMFGILRIKPVKTLVGKIFPI